MSDQWSFNRKMWRASVVWVNKPKDAPNAVFRSFFAACGSWSNWAIKVISDHTSWTIQQQLIQPCRYRWVIYYFFKKRRITEPYGSPMRSWMIKVYSYCWYEFVSKWLQEMEITFKEIHKVFLAKLKLFKVENRKIFPNNSSQRSKQ